MEENGIDFRGDSSPEVSSPTEGGRWEDAARDAWGPSSTATDTTTTSSAEDNPSGTDRDYPTTLELDTTALYADEGLRALKSSAADERSVAASIGETTLAPSGEPTIAPSPDTLTNAMQGSLSGAETRTEPVAAETLTEPVVAETRTEPVAAETRTEPAAAETRTEPAAAESRTEPVAAETRTEPAAAETRTEPAAAESRTEPAAAESERSGENFEEVERLVQGEANAAAQVAAEEAAVDVRLAEAETDAANQPEVAGTNVEAQVAATKMDVSAKLAEAATDVSLQMERAETEEGSTIGAPEIHADRIAATGTESAVKETETAAVEAVVETAGLVQSTDNETEQPETTVGPIAADQPKATEEPVASEQSGTMPAPLALELPAEASAAAELLASQSERNKSQPGTRDGEVSEDDAGGNGGHNGTSKAHHQHHAATPAHDVKYVESGASAPSDDVVSRGPTKIAPSSSSYARGAIEGDSVTRTVARGLSAAAVARALGTASGTERNVNDRHNSGPNPESPHTQVRSAASTSARSHSDSGPPHQTPVHSDSSLTRPSTLPAVRPGDRNSAASTHSPEHHLEPTRHPTTAEAGRTHADGSKARTEVKHQPPARENPIQPNRLSRAQTASEHFKEVREPSIVRPVGAGGETTEAREAREEREDEFLELQEAHLTRSGGPGSETAEEVSPKLVAARRRASKEEGMSMLGAEIALAALVISASVAKDRHVKSKLKNKLELSNTASSNEGELEVEAVVDNQTTNDEEQLPQLPLVRPSWLVRPNEDLVKLAEHLFHEGEIAWLIADLNAGNVKESLLDGKRVVELRSRQRIDLPVWQDIVQFHKTKQDVVKVENLITIVTESGVDTELMNVAMAGLASAMGVGAEGLGSGKPQPVLARSSANRRENRNASGTAILRDRNGGTGEFQKLHPLHARLKETRDALLAIRQTTETWLRSDNDHRGPTAGASVVSSTNDVILAANRAAKGLLALDNREGPTGIAPVTKELPVSAS